MNDQVDIETKKRNELDAYSSILTCHNLSKYYDQGDSRLKILESIFFDVKQAGGNTAQAMLICSKCVVNI